MITFLRGTLSRAERSLLLVNLAVALVALLGIVVSLVVTGDVRGWHIGLGALALVDLWFVREAVRAPGRRDAVDAVGALAADFFAAGRVAIVGLSTREDSFSRAVAKEMTDRGIEVVPIHPDASEIAGLRAFPRLSACADAPASVLVMTPASAAEEVVDACVEAGVRHVWFHRGAGPGSGTPEASRRARDAGLVVIDDVCPLMFLEPVQWIHRAHRGVRFDNPSKAPRCAGCSAA